MRLSRINRQFARTRIINVVPKRESTTSEKKRRRNEEKKQMQRQYEVIASNEVDAN